MINSLHQRAEILAIFALSRVWYRAQVLPLPKKFAVQFEKEISNFLWRGHLTKNVLSGDTVCLPKERGGLSIPHLRLKCRSLFMKQMLRSISGNGKGKEHVDFWLGDRLSLPQLSSCFHYLKRLNKDCTPQIFTTTLSYISEALDDGTITASEIKDITTKQIYNCYLENLPSPSVEQRLPSIYWALKWSRLQSGV